LARQNRGAGTKPILEINLRHPLVAAITQAEATSGAAADLSFLFAGAGSRVNNLVLRGLNARSSGTGS